MLDRIDEQLVQMLGKDARQSSDTLAKKLGISPATVRRRIKGLIKNEVIRTTVLVNPDKVGYPLTSIIAFDVELQNVESALKFLASRPEVKWAVTTTGRYDILVWAAFRSTNELADFVEKGLSEMEGVKDTETFVCLRVEKTKYIPV